MKLAGLKQFVLDQGKAHVMVALYTRRGKMIRIKRIGRAPKLYLPEPPSKPVS